MLKMDRPAPTTFTLVKQQLLPPHWVEAGLEWLLERLPRRRIPIIARPAKDIKSMPGGADSWLSEGSAPTFECHVEGGWPAGWYYLEAALIRHNGSREAELRRPADDGTTTLITPVSSNLRGSIREVFYLARDVETLHWVPTRSRGIFSQSPLLAHRISALESFLRRAHRVALDSWRFRQTTHAAGRALRWRAAIRDLRAAYLAGTQLVGADPRQPIFTHPKCEGSARHRDG